VHYSASMQPSSLVQEAFLRLIPGSHAKWRDRAHFFAAASKVMRHILVDYARRRRREKRGGGAFKGARRESSLANSLGRAM
jgi:DNA-directed RNA polymerase specialized sigma24 family protein